MRGGAREQILQQLKGYFESDKLTKLAQQFAAHMLIRMPTVKDQNESKHVKFSPKLSKNYYFQFKYYDTGVRFVLAMPIA